MSISLSSLLSNQSQAKAWVSFASNSSGSTIYQSYNVDSVTRNSAGVYTINFVSPSPFSNSNYCAVGSFGGGVNALFSQDIPDSGGISTSSFRLHSGSVNNTPGLQEAPYTSVAFFGN